MTTVEEGLLFLKKKKQKDFTSLSRFWPAALVIVNNGFDSHFTKETTCFAAPLALRLGNDRGTISATILLENGKAIRDAAKAVLNMADTLPLLNGVFSKDAAGVAGGSKDVG